MQLRVPSHLECEVLSLVLTQDDIGTLQHDLLHVCYLERDIYVGKVYACLTHDCSVLCEVGASRVTQ